MPKAATAFRILLACTSGLAALSAATLPSTAQLWPWAQPQTPPVPRAPIPQYSPRPAPKPAAPKPAPKAEAPKPEVPKADAQPAAEEPPPPYEPELLRLSEILGALTYLRDICGSPDADVWRGRMQALLDAEAKTASRKEHLAGAYNRGFHGYEISYRVCTPNAQLIIRRFLAEGEKIAHDVVNRYGSS